jgi:hypothetical protein
MAAAGCRPETGSSNQERHMTDPKQDPLKRQVPPRDVPLQSPMPRSPILDREEPEPSQEQDIESDSPSKDRG